MKMLNKHAKSKTKYQNIIATGIDGESMTFKTVKDIAAFFDVHVVAIYKALKNKTKVRGCILSIGEYDEKQYQK